MACRFVEGNDIHLLETGKEFFPALIEAIQNARYEIFLETYIYAEDTSGKAVAKALRAAAKRGIKTHLLLDGFGSNQLSHAFIAALQADGVQVLFFRPQGKKGFPFKLLRRLHRKIALIDDHIAFVGGINIQDDFSPNPLPYPRLDYAVSIRGPVLADIRKEVARLWRLASFRTLKIKRYAPDRPHFVPPLQGHMKAALVVRDNFRHHKDIEEAYLDAIDRAKESIIIANAYFLPGHKFRHALKSAVKRGVNVKLLMQGQIEYFWAYYASHALYRELLEGGIEIYDYTLSFMHGKAAVIDCKWATVGSSNIEPLSFFHAREANIVVEDQAFSRTLHQRLLHAIEAGSIAVTIENLSDSYWETLWLRTNYFLLSRLAQLSGWAD
jgi:cardiolipin synthase